MIPEAKASLHAINSCDSCDLLHDKNILHDKKINNSVSCLKNNAHLEIKIHYNKNQNGIHDYFTKSKLS